MGRPPEVLPVVSVQALVPLVLLVREGAPRCFEVEHVEVDVTFEALEDVHRQFRLSVGEGAHAPVLAEVDLVGVALAELGLVLLGVVEVFDAVVSADTGVTLGAITLSPLDIGAHFGSIKSWHAATVPLVRVVVVQAFFAVVGLSNLARHRLENHEVQERNSIVWNRSGLYAGVLRDLSRTYGAHRC